MQPMTPLKDLNVFITQLLHIQEHVVAQTGYKEDQELLTLVLEASEHSGEWVDGIKRLLHLASDLDTSGGKAAAKFLCSIYNGRRASFDLADLNKLSMLNWLDAMNILKLNKLCCSEIHNYIEDGNSVFEDLIKRVNNHKN